MKIQDNRSMYSYSDVSTVVWVVDTSGEVSHVLDLSASRNSENTFPLVFVSNTHFVIF